MSAKDAMHALPRWADIPRPLIPLVPLLVGVACLNSISEAAFLAIVSQAAWDDHRDGKIYNRTTYAGWALVLLLTIASIDYSGLTFNLGGLVAHWDWAALDLRESLWGSVACFAVMLVLYSMGAAGAGDAKLAAVIGATLGIQQGLSVLFWGHFLGGVMGLASSSYRYGPHVVLIAMVKYLATATIPVTWEYSEPESRVVQARVRLGVYFALGTIIVLLGGNLL